MKKVLCLGVFLIAVMSAASAGNDSYTFVYPLIGVNDGFVFNPYQPGDSDGNQPVVIAAAVAYILGEIKYFTIFFILSAILALSACAILVYIIMNGIFKPAEKPAKIQKDVSDGKGDDNMKGKEQDNGLKAVASGISVEKDSGDYDEYIDRQSASMVLLYICINEMLSAINSTIEESEAGRRVASR